MQSLTFNIRILRPVSAPSVRTPGASVKH